MNPPAPREVVMASTWRRALAFLPELMIAAVVGLAVATARGWLDWSQIPPDRRWNAFDQVVDTLNAQGPGLLWAAITTLLALAALGLLFDVALGASPFKHLGGLTLVDARGRRPALWRLALRHLGRPISTGMLGWGLAWAAFDRHRRALHDRVAGVYVIRQGPSAPARRETWVDAPAPPSPPGPP